MTQQHDEDRVACGCPARRAAAICSPEARATSRSPSGRTMVLATVKGDVHDIGKNLVDIILSNNGYTVVTSRSALLALPTTPTTASISCACRCCNRRRPSSSSTTMGMKISCSWRGTDLGIPFHRMQSTTAQTYGRCIR